MCAEPIYHRAHHKEANSRWGRVCVHTPFLPRDNVMWLHSSMPRSNSQSPQTLSLTLPSRRGRVLNTSWGAQDVAWHVMVMTMHRVSMETHWLLSIVAQCHMIITCKPHGMKLIGMSEFRNKPKKALDAYWDPSPSLGGVWGWDYVDYQTLFSHAYDAVAIPPPPSCGKVGSGSQDWSYY